MKNEEYFNPLVFSLKELVKEFINNPYSYFYEEDIRVDFVNFLKRRLSHIKLNHMDKEILTSPVKCEYPSNLPNKQRHDIVLLNPDNINNIYNLEISCAIEIKLGSKSYDRCSEFKEDIRKLQAYQTKIFLGLAIYFYQDRTDINIIKEWFKDISKDFEIKEIDNLSFEEPTVYSLIVAPEDIILETHQYLSVY